MSILSASTRTGFPAAQTKLRRADFFLIAGIILATGFIRLLASAGDFTMSEVSGWQISRMVARPLEILTAPEARVDQNHPLSTLVPYLLGNRSLWALYRVLSLATGVGAVILAARIM